MEIATSTEKKRRKKTHIHWTYTSTSIHLYTYAEWNVCFLPPAPLLFLFIIIVFLVAVCLSHFLCIAILRNCFSFTAQLFRHFTFDTLTSFPWFVFFFVLSHRYRMYIFRPSALNCMHISYSKGRKEQTTTKKEKKNSSQKTKTKIDIKMAQRTKIMSQI